MDTISIHNIEHYCGKELSKQELCDLFMNALDEMNFYNGRSARECLRIAIMALHTETQQFTPVPTQTD